MASVEKEELTFAAIRNAIVARLFADLPMRTMLEGVDYTRSELEESIGDALEELGIGC